MKKIATSLLFCVLLTVGAIAQKSIDTTISHNGLTRSYNLYIPDSFTNSKAVPLVLNLHGYGSNKQQQKVYGDFRDIADTANFLIAHPNGTTDSSGTRFWDAFDASPVDDVGFLATLIDTISNRYAIDTNRIYSTGMSNGGFMSHQLACRLSERITAIASVTGSMMPYQRNTCNPVHPTPVMQIHGTNDNTVPYYGNAQYLPVDSVVGYWVDYNNCTPSPTVNQVPDTDPTDGCTAEQYVYKGGDDDSRVELYKVIGGGHTWPGAPVNIGVTNQDFNASKVIWQFFNRYPTQEDTVTSVSTAEDRGQFTKWQIFPNPSQGKIRFNFADKQVKKIKIFSLTGKPIASFTCACRNTQYILDKKGVYFISISKGSHHKTKSIIIR